MNSNSTRSPARETEDLAAIRAGLYEFASCLMQAPLNGHSTEDVINQTDSAVVRKIADVYDYTDMGAGREDGVTPEAYLTRFVGFVLGVSQVDLAVKARLFADAL